MTAHWLEYGQCKCFFEEFADEQVKSVYRAQMRCLYLRFTREAEAGFYCDQAEQSHPTRTHQLNADVAHRHWSRPTLLVTARKKKAKVQATFFSQSLRASGHLQPSAVMIAWPPC
jgi:hypothetical protein